MMPAAQCQAGHILDAPGLHTDTGSWMGRQIRPSHMAFFTTLYKTPESLRCVI